MNCFAPTFLALAATIVTASGRIGDTPAQLRERLGAPTAEAVDKDGYGLRIYRTAECKEIRVTFVASKSQREVYQVEQEGEAVRPILAALRRENPGERVFEGFREIKVGKSEPEGDLKLVNHSGREHTCTGRATMKKVGEFTWLLLRDRDTVIEIPMANPLPGLEAGMDCTVTVLDAGFEDLHTQLAIVGRREHVDWPDAVNDAHDAIQLLVRVTTPTGVIFDRAVCAVHHLAMQLREVPIAYGMMGTSEAEAYADKHFPHFRDYAAGGCIVGEAKTTQIYVCPSCTVAYAAYRRKHPPPKGE